MTSGQGSQDRQFLQLLQTAALTYARTKANETKVWIRGLPIRKWICSIAARGRQTGEYNRLCYKTVGQTNTAETTRVHDGFNYLDKTALDWNPGCERVELATWTLQVLMRTKTRR